MNHIIWYNQLFSDNAKKIAQKKLDIATEEVALEMKAFNDVNRKRVQELLTLINVIQQYQIEVN